MRSIKNHNRTLLAKWLWRFGSEDKSFWCKVVVARFGEKSRWEPNVVRIRHGCGLCKSICALRDVFWKHICFKVELGREIRFWEDKWVGDAPLKDVFRTLYGLALDSNSLVMESFDFDRNI